ncbi:macrolide 2'-phosphotransferase [Litorihabitans aurantiacus]|uniref:Aminoglycoside phosphotransferase n=1 Tax=Litorihabitans aurantiacus TaxID=1930061 RepID=A0AA38CR21_9MICO|nr:macrolide 2'-phosphotransferase [Litorihabitans aurantiacus]GMA32708.1 aminoglycoside phosphotransferase [Litorihabitans aurantiacus]
MTTAADILALAAGHGLDLDPAGATLSEAGLDYRVVMADDADGRRWVLRAPRRDDVSDGMAAEARVLDLVGPVLARGGVAVPDWRVRERDLVAYPALPGTPGLTLTPEGEPVWHVDPRSPDYAARLGRLLARLHAITAQEASAAGVEVRTPEEVRQAWRDDVARVTDAFTVAPALARRWQEWLDDETCWPDRTVMTHGEIYQAHVLQGPDGTFLGVLDWTTARVDDPARDLVTQLGAGGPEMLQVALAAYAEAGGRAHDGLAAQAQHLWDASPIGYALYALTTGAEADRATAAALLDPR